MQPDSLFEDIDPFTRVLIVVLPFAIAVCLRVILGRSRTAGWLITLGTAWFAANVLMAPYSSRMRQDVRNLSRRLP